MPRLMKVYIPTSVLAGGKAEDTTAPTVVITCAQTSPSNAATLNFTITFSASVTGFAIDKFTVAGGTKGNFAGSGKDYTCDVTPNGDSAVTADVAANVVDGGNSAATQLKIGIQVTLTYQPDGTAGVDEYLNSAAPDGDTRDSTTLRIQASALNTIIKFPISTGASPTVVSGTLSLWGTTVGANGAVYTISRILPANSGWNESSTWNYKTPTTIRWAGDAAGDGGADAGCSVSGADFSATPLGTITDHAEAAGQQYDAALDTTELAAMIANNCGLVILSNSATIKRFNSCEGATAGTRPKLVMVVNFFNGPAASRIYSVGDSRTYGSGDDIPPVVGMNGWPYILTNLLTAQTGIVWHEERFAVGGIKVWTSDPISVPNLKSGIDAKLAATYMTPDFVFMAGGYNDAGTGETEADFEANYGYILDALHTKWPRAIILCDKIQNGDSDVNPWIATVLTTRSWATFGTDEGSFLPGPGNIYMYDGSHPNHDGYALWAAAAKTAMGY